jgi:hypothetical protein
MLHGKPGRVLTAVVTVLLGISLLLTGGCYGSFPLTNTIYDINGAPENRLLETLVFWLFLIIPVYSVAMLADAIVLNVIQFWFGADVDTVEVTGPEGEIVRLEPLNRRKARLTVVPKKGPSRSVFFVRTTEDCCEVRSTQGKLLGTVRRDENGGFTLRDTDGKTARHISAGEVASYLQSTPDSNASAQPAPAGL